MRNESQETLKRLRDSYDIKVPDSARNSVLAGISRAKKEQKRFAVLHMVRNTGIGAAAAVMALTVVVNTNETVANAMENIPVIGALAKVVTFRTFEDKTGNLEANIQIPQIDSGTVGSSGLSVNQSIEEYAQSLIAQYEKEVSENQGEGHYQLSSSYEVVTDDQHYLSIRINTTEVMASGAEYVKIFTIDKATGEVVTLKQLFSDKPDYIDIISENIKTQMKEQMAADNSKMYFLDTDMPDTDFNKITGDESFYFSKTGDLVLVFDEYAVAPGYMGTPEFIIPKTIISE